VLESGVTLIYGNVKVRIFTKIHKIYYGLYDVVNVFYSLKTENALNYMCVMNSFSKNMRFTLQNQPVVDVLNIFTAYYENHRNAHV